MASTTENAVSYENPWSSPPSPTTTRTIKEAKYMPPYTLVFPNQKDYGVWDSLPVTKSKSIGHDGSWGKTAASTLTTSENTNPDLFLAPPKEVVRYQDWQDDVSVLNDNPDDDDIECLFLPQSTYDVLMPLFNDLYIHEEPNNTIENQDQRQDGSDARAA